MVSFMECILCSIQRLVLSGLKRKMTLEEILYIHMEINQKRATHCSKVQVSMLNQWYF